MLKSPMQPKTLVITTIALLFVLIIALAGILAVMLANRPKSAEDVFVAFLYAEAGLDAGMSRATKESVQDEGIFLEAYTSLNQDNQLLMNLEMECTYSETKLGIGEIVISTSSILTPTSFYTKYNEYSFEFLEQAGFTDLEQVTSQLITGEYINMTSDSVPAAIAAGKEVGVTISPVAAYAQPEYHQPLIDALINNGTYSILSSQRQGEAEDEYVVLDVVTNAAKYKEAVLSVIPDFPNIDQAIRESFLENDEFSFTIAIRVSDSEFLWMEYQMGNPCVQDVLTSELEYTPQDLPYMVMVRAVPAPQSQLTQVPQSSISLDKFIDNYWEFWGRYL